MIVKQPIVYILAGRGGKPWIPAFAGMTSQFFAGMTSLLFGGMTSLLFGGVTSLLFGGMSFLFFAGMTFPFRHARGGGHPRLPEFHAARVAQRHGALT